MKILLIIYAVSWLILLGVYISSLFSKNRSSSSEKTPWYVYVAMIVLAPLAVFILPYILYTDYRDKKQEQKRKAEREAEKEKANAIKFAAMKAYNSASIIEADYALIGKQLHKLAEDKNYNNFLDCLNKIHLPSGEKLKVEECSPETGDIGDESTLYILMPNEEADEKIFEHLIVEQSAMGAWQAYLLYNLWHVLPLFWHGNYHARDYIFSKEDVNQINTYTTDEKKRNAIIALISDFDFTPEVRESNGKYFVSSCYWSNFGGLIREYYGLTFDGNRIADIIQLDSKIEYKYNCGIYF